MTFPCPHCKKSFGFEPQTGAVAGDLTLKCPACGGKFILRASPPLHRESQGAGPPRERRPEADAPGHVSVGHEPIPTAYHAPDTREHEEGDLRRGPLGPVPAPKVKVRKKRRRKIFRFGLIALFLICTVFLAYQIITEHKDAQRDLLSTLPTHDPGETAARESMSATSIQGKGQAGTQQGPSVAVPFFHLEDGDVCQRLSALQDEILRKGADNAQCEVFTLWTGYLVDEASSSTRCSPDQAFTKASEGAHAHTLCGAGYTFLAAYYLSKEMGDRARVFLNQARELSPEDPWMYLVDARCSQLIDQDPQASIQSLKKSISYAPDFLHAHYLLATAYLETEAYKEAEDELVWLQHHVDKGEEFQTLISLLHQFPATAPYSAQRAQVLLDISRSQLGFKEYRLAELLHRQVLIEMGLSLPQEQRKMAFYELGQIYERRGNDRQAYAAYQSALRLDPHFTDARARIEALGTPPSRSSGTVPSRRAADASGHQDAPR